MNSLVELLPQMTSTGLTGTVARLEGALIVVSDLPAPVGATVEVARGSMTPLQGEVVAFRGNLALVFPWGDVTGVRYGQRVKLRRSLRTVRVGEALLGRVIDSLGRPLDGRPAPACITQLPIERAAPAPLDRPRIDEPLGTGVRTLDALLTCGRGQRVGIFSGAGVGKSTLLGMMARGAESTVNVIALIGERGREVNEFLQRDLGPAGLARSVVVVSTSDEPAPLRCRAAWAATAIAEHFRDQGQDVLLVMDSLTRFALALREIGLASGETAAARGFPPSVFSHLPRLVERAGRTREGSITGFYSVLIEGDDPREPISDAVRALLDGHLMLSRSLAARGHFPAIEVLDSVSRVQLQVTGREQQQAVQRVREILAAYRQHEDLITIGAYRRGSQPLVDLALALDADFQRFLRQGIDERTTLEQARTQLLQLVERAARMK